MPLREAGPSLAKRIEAVLKRAARPLYGSEIQDAIADHFGWYERAEISSSLRKMIISGCIVVSEGPRVNERGRRTIKLYAFLERRRDRGRPPTALQRSDDPDDWTLIRKMA